jgi:hypothetical protein
MSKQFLWNADAWKNQGSIPIETNVVNSMKKNLLMDELCTRQLVITIMSSHRHHVLYYDVGQPTNVMLV